MLRSQPIDEVECLMREVSQKEPLASIVEEHLATGGKRIRASLALASTQALGEDPQKAIGWAAAVEIVHNGTLIHDDLQDGDRTRRGKPTIWVRHGLAQAINAGDLMLMLPVTAIDRVTVDDQTKWKLSRLLGQAVQDVVRGQSEELGLIQACTQPDLRARYNSCIRGKTASLFRASVEGAALISGLSSQQASQVASDFETLGLIFQMQDDVLDLYGQKGRERPGRDIQEGKVSALVLEHLSLYPKDLPTVVRILQAPREETGEEEVSFLIEKFKTGGALNKVLGEIEKMSAQVHESERLKAWPELQKLADELAALILEPISNVRGVV